MLSEGSWVAWALSRMGRAKHKPTLEMGKGRWLERQEWVPHREIGEGSFGTVFLVTDSEKKKRIAALKIEAAGDWRSSLEMEGIVLQVAGRKGKNLVKAMARGDLLDKENLKCDFLLLEFLHPLYPSLENLTKCFPNKQLHPVTALRIGIQALRGLLHLHKIGVLHRDLKPENIGLLPPPNDGVVVILDLGLCRPFTNNDGTVREPRCAPGARGSVLFMSSRVYSERECSRGDDLWSWFYTVLELILGEGMLPWDVAENRAQTVLKLKGSNVPADLLLKGLPLELYTVYFHLSILKFEDRPDYNLLFHCMAQSLRQLKADPALPLVSLP